MRHAGLAALSTICATGLLAPGCDAAGGLDGKEPHWSYEGASGPEHWGALSEEWAACGEGTAQSPIDLVVADLVASEEPKPALAWASTTLSAANTGHTVRYDVDAGSTLTWRGQVYDLVQFHFHGGAEHTVGGNRMAAEIHFVHALRDDPDALAVVASIVTEDASGPVGVYDEGGALSFRDALALPVSDAPTALGGSVALGEIFADLSRWDVIRYTGSLTTPPCTEGVEFFVLDELAPMRPEDVEALHEVYDANYRPVQPLNGRVVTLHERSG